MSSHQSINGRSAKYSFPVLSNQELIACLSELRVPMAKEDITKPKYVQLRVVYEHFVDLLMGVRPEDMKQPQFSTIDVMECPELHEESIPDLIWTAALTKLMQTCGVHDFSLNDLYEPDYPRTRRCLSALINFAKFREERLMNYQQFLAETETVTQERNELEVKAQGLQELLAEVQKVRAEEQPHVTALSTEVTALAEEINTLNDRQAAMRTEAHEFKEKAKQLEVRNASERSTLWNVKKDVAQLKSQVVSSPKRIRKQLADMTLQLADERDVVEQSKRRNRDLVVKMDALDNVANDLNKSARIMGECEVELSKLAAAQATNENIQETAANLRMKMSELSATESLRKRQVNGAHEKLARLRRQNELKAQSAERSMEDASRTREAIENERLSVQGKIALNEETTKAILDKITNMEAEYDEEVRTLKEEFSRLHDQVGHYHTALLGSLTATV